MIDLESFATEAHVMPDLGDGGRCAAFIQHLSIVSSRCKLLSLLAYYFAVAIVDFALRYLLSRSLISPSCWMLLELPMTMMASPKAAGTVMGLTSNTR